MDMFDITFFRTGVVALFVASLFDIPKRMISEKVTVIIASLLGLVFGSVLVHAFQSAGLHNSLNLFMAVLGLRIVYIYHDKNKDLSKYILAAALINLIFYFVQKGGFDPIWSVHPYVGQEGALLGNQPRLMTYFALIMPFGGMYLIIAGILLGIYSQQIVVFIPAVLMIFARIKSFKGRLIAGLLTFLALVLFRHKIMDSLFYRFHLAWAPALTAFFKQPLIGLGLGERFIPELGVVGNSYLQLIMGVGILGAVWFWYMFKILGRSIMRNVPILSLAVIMLVEYPIEIPRLWFLIMAIVVLFLIKKGEND